MLGLNNYILKKRTKLKVNTPSQEKNLKQNKKWHSEFLQLTKISVALFQSLKTVPLSILIFCHKCS